MFQLLWRGALAAVVGWAMSAAVAVGQTPQASTQPSGGPALYGIKVDANAKKVSCRTIPFVACAPESRGETKRVGEAAGVERIPIGAQAKTLYLLGMINHGWDHGLAHWGEHPEFMKERPDRILIGTQIGDLDIRYADGTSDTIPLIIGVTAWHFDQWDGSSPHGYQKPVKEPFASRPDRVAVLARVLRLGEDATAPPPKGRRKRGEAPASRENFSHYYLAVKPRAKVIDSVVVRDNLSFRGCPIVSGVTLDSPQPAEGFEAFAQNSATPEDLAPRIDAAKPGDWTADLKALAAALYTTEKDLPKNPALLEFPKTLDAARLRFLGGGRWGNMLTNVWTQNLEQISRKFESKTGYFRETLPDSAFYGGYNGIGTFAPDVGVYADGAFGRCADHYATIALRLINDPQRWTSFVDFCDKYLYFYRANHDPALGPPNEQLDITKYPKDAPGHWGFVVNTPYCLPTGLINEIDGEEEMDGHGATVVARWVSWRKMGCPAGEWLKSPRNEIYGKSRWDSTRDAAEFICWFMDYTGRDVIFSEGESTQWGGGAGPKHTRVPDNMAEQTDEAARKVKYAKADMYEVYPSYVCMVALRCSAEIAEAAGQRDMAKKWRAYADRIQRAMIKELPVGEGAARLWRCTMSVFPSGMEALAPAWFAIYIDGYDSQKWNPDFREITHNYLMSKLNAKPGPGTAAVLATGYGQGWLTHSALFLDEMDAAGECLVNIAKYAYDKNVDYADEKRGINWRRWLYLLPEGTHVLPKGSTPLPDEAWYRIGDLTNGANQGPAMHALEASAGVDDTDGAHIKILPRIPDPLTGIEVSNFLTLVQENGKPQIARLNYQYTRDGSFKLQSDRMLPDLAIRLGPFDSEQAAQAAKSGGAFPQGATLRVEKSGRYKGKDAYWLWLEGIHNVSRTDIQLKNGKGQ